MRKVDSMVLALLRIYAGDRPRGHHAGKLETDGNQTPEDDKGGRAKMTNTITANKTPAMSDQSMVQHDQRDGERNWIQAAAGLRGNVEGGARGHQLRERKRNRIDD